MSNNNGELARSFYREMAGDTTFIGQTHNTFGRFQKVDAAGDPIKFDRAQLEQIAKELIDDINHIIPDGAASPGGPVGTGLRGNYEDPPSPDNFERFLYDQIVNSPATSPEELSRHLLSIKMPIPAPTDANKNAVQDGGAMIAFLYAALDEGTGLPQVTFTTEELQVIRDVLNQFGMGGLMPFIDLRMEQEPDLDTGKVKYISDAYETMVNNSYRPEDFPVDGYGIPSSFDGIARQLEDDGAITFVNADERFAFTQWAAGQVIGRKITTFDPENPNVVDHAQNILDSMINDGTIVVQSDQAHAGLKQIITDMDTTTLRDHRVAYAFNKAIEDYNANNLDHPISYGPRIKNIINTSDDRMNDSNKRMTVDSMVAEYFEPFLRAEGKREFRQRLEEWAAEQDGITVHTRYSEPGEPAATGDIPNLDGSPSEAPPTVSAATLVAPVATRAVAVTVRDDFNRGPSLPAPPELPDNFDLGNTARVTVEPRVLKELLGEYYNLAGDRGGEVMDGDDVPLYQVTADGMESMEGGGEFAAIRIVGELGSKPTVQLVEVEGQQYAYLSGLDSSDRPMEYFRIVGEGETQRTEYYPAGYFVEVGENGLNLEQEINIDGLKAIDEAASAGAIDKHMETRATGLQGIAQNLKQDLSETLSETDLVLPEPAGCAETTAVSYGTAVENITRDQALDLFRNVDVYSIEGSGTQSLIRSDIGDEDFLEKLGGDQFNLQFVYDAGGDPVVAFISNDDGEGYHVGIGQDGLDMDALTTAQKNILSADPEEPDITTDGSLVAAEPTPP